MRTTDKIRALTICHFPACLRGIPSRELLSSLRIHHLNFFSDGTIELWYSGGDPFEWHDIRMELDADLRLSEVGLDG